MEQTMKFPFYAKLAFTLTSLIAIWVIGFYGQNIITPVVLAGLFAILLSPLKRFLERWFRLPHVISSLMAVVIFVLFLSAVIFFMSWQISDMIADWEKIKANLNIHIAKLQQLISDNFNFSKTQQLKYLNETASDTGKQIVGSTLISVSDTLLNLILVFIYCFLMLLYKSHFVKFLCKLFDERHHAKVREILAQVRVSIQSYIGGLFIEMIIVSILTAIGLMIIDVPYAILLGLITGILNLIPYIGILFAGVLTIVASLSGSPDLSIIVGVIVVNIIVQFIDNNVLVPLIVSSKVEINALVSIVGIVAGGAMGGIAGMFLAIPVIAIFKVVFDRIEGLSPWGYLFGDDMPKTYTWHNVKLPLYVHDKTSVTVNTTADPEIAATEKETQQP